jgi:hypothetical protein
MKGQLIAERQNDPNFRFANDGVHINAAGHWVIAREILLHWKALSKEAAQATSGEEAVSAYPHGAEALKLVTERQRLLKDAWLTAVGHKRPGMNPGVPLDQAKHRADELDAQINQLLAPAP